MVYDIRHDALDLRVWGIAEGDQDCIADEFAGHSKRRKRSFVFTHASQWAE
jgi:hypothetical protein